MSFSSAVGGPQRLQRRRTPGWRMPEGAAYVGRPSRWGNPFHVLRGHHVAGPAWSVARDSWGHVPAEECVALYVSSSAVLGPEEAVQRFRSLLEVRRRDEPDRLRRWLAPLSGRHLACWCPLEQACHADVLLEYANAG